MNPFSFNTKNIQKINILGTDLFIIDNFYQDPDKVVNIIQSQPSHKWKHWDTPSFNGKYFLDHRHDFINDDSKIYNTFFEDITGQKIGQSGRIVTNCMDFYDKTFNNYIDNYWGPHNDLGYTGLVYLNNFESEGTNFYTRIGEDIWNTPEHYDPWRAKTKYNLEYTVPAKYNRLVLFDGKTLCHGMAIDSDKFFNNKRINQAIFLL